MGPRGGTLTGNCVAGAYAQALPRAPVFLFRGWKVTALRYNLLISISEALCK